MKTEQPILVSSIVAKEEFPKGRCITFAGYMCTEGSKQFGVSQTSGSANELIPLTVQGIALCQIGMSVTAGAKLQVMDDGYVSPYSDGEIIGYAMDAASNVGDLVRVLLV